MEKTINIAEDFSDFPLGRYISDGRYNGERFRREFLVPALQQYDSIRIELSGLEAFPSSFGEEVFGGLIRHEGFQLEDVRRRISIDAPGEYAGYKNDIIFFMEEAAKAFVAA